MVIVSAFAVFVGLLGFRLFHHGYYGATLFDDAYFFARYAGNFLDTGIFEWNRGEGPVYGNTSQFYQLLVTLLHWLTGRDVVLTLVLGATLGALAYVAIVPFVYFQMRPHLAASVGWPTAACIVVLAAFDGLIFPFVSGGMETTWGMALVALALFCTFRVQNGVTGIGSIFANGLMILLVFMTRPDAALIAFLAPAGLVLFAKDARVRRAGIAVCAAGLMLIAGFILACWLYYGSALPLAFITKTSPLTTLPAEEGTYLGDTVMFLGETLLFHKAEVILALCGLFMPSRWTPALRGAAAGMVLLVLYHVLLVLPITGDYGRFYAPAFPVLVLLATPAMEKVWEGLQTLRPSRGLAIAFVAALVLLIAHRPLRVTLVLLPGYFEEINDASKITTGRQAAILAATHMMFFEGRLPALIEASGTECSLASTEDGMLSALAAKNRIVDLSGLHDRRMAHKGFSADRILTEQKPDILVRPPAWYAPWIEALEKHPALERDYIREPARFEKGPWIAFRRDSACALKVRKAIYGR